MSDERKVVYGIYQNKSQVDTVINRLKANNFLTSDISVLLPRDIGSQDLQHTKTSKAPEGAATGAGTGAVIGGAVGLLVGIGALAIPGVGPFIAAGPIMSALAGIGLGGTVGGVGGALVGMGMPEYEAKRYEGSVKNGGILFSVHAATSMMADQAKEILLSTGADDVTVTSEAKGDFKSPPPPVIRKDGPTSTAQVY